MNFNEFFQIVGKLEEDVDTAGITREMTDIIDKFYKCVHDFYSEIQLKELLETGNLIGEVRQEVLDALKPLQNAFSILRQDESVAVEGYSLTPR